MELIIKGDKTIAQLQREFSEVFPFLKIEFFDVPYKADKALPRDKMIKHDRKLSAIKRMHGEGAVQVLPGDKVGDFETRLWDTFGLSAQVFRKSGNMWIETSLTDQWTLERQNNEGLEMETPPHSNPYQQADDRDLTDRDKWE
jgi:hypothetical protein